MKAKAQLIKDAPYKENIQIYRSKQDKERQSDRERREREREAGREKEC